MLSNAAIAGLGIPSISGLSAEQIGALMTTVQTVMDQAFERHFGPLQHSNPTPTPPLNSPVKKKRNRKSRQQYKSKAQSLSVPSKHAILHRKAPWNWVATSWYAAAIQWNALIGGMIVFLEWSCSEASRGCGLINLRCGWEQHLRKTLRAGSASLLFLTARSLIRVPGNLWGLYQVLARNLCLQHAEVSVQQPHIRSSISRPKCSWGACTFHSRFLGSVSLHFFSRRGSRDYLGIRPRLRIAWFLDFLLGATLYACTHLFSFSRWITGQGIYEWKMGMNWETLACESVGFCSIWQL